MDLISGWEKFHILQATTPVYHNYGTHKLYLSKPMHPRARAPQQEKPLQWEAHTPQLEKTWTVTKTQYSQK